MTNQDAIVSIVIVPSKIEHVLTNMQRKKNISLYVIIISFVFSVVLNLISVTESRNMYVAHLFAQCVLNMYTDVRYVKPNHPKRVENFLYFVFDIETTVG